MAATRDSEYVGRHNDEKLRRFLVARRAGDEAGAHHWWQELLTDNYDRIRGMIMLQSRGRLSADEQDEALQRALIRIAGKMIDSFRGTSMGEWVEATRTLVKYACIDTQRRAAVISKRERSLERAGRGDDDTAREDVDVYAAIEAQRREQESVAEDQEALREAQGFLDWAVPQLSPKRRAVIQLDRADVPVEDIQKQLGVSRDVVYAARSRALKDLVKLRDDYQP